MTFAIVSDSSCNLSSSIAKELDITILPFYYLLNGQLYPSYSDVYPIDMRGFYQHLRDGDTITTSQPNIAETESTFRNLAEQGKDILYIGFSSALSGGCESTMTILDMVASDFPERTFLSIDTLAASFGEGQLVVKAAKMAQLGSTIQETYDWIKDNMQHSAHWFTVDDLMFLYRGGRVSKSSALAGTVLNIKPVFHTSDEGKLVPTDKVRGRKKVLSYLADQFVATAYEPQDEQTVYICHGDCIDDAHYVADQIRAKAGVSNFVFDYLEPVIGAHCGPGTIGVFWFSEVR